MLRKASHTSTLCPFFCRRQLLLLSEKFHHSAPPIRWVLLFMNISSCGISRLDFLLSDNRIIKLISYLHDSFLVTSLKNKIENNSTWEGAFYQIEWVKFTEVELLSFFHFLCVAANASELFCMVHLVNINILHHSNISL